MRIGVTWQIHWDLSCHPSCIIKYIMISAETLQSDLAYLNSLRRGFLTSQSPLSQVHLPPPTPHEQIPASLHQPHFNNHFFPRFPLSILSLPCQPPRYPNIYFWKTRRSSRAAQNPPERASPQSLHSTQYSFADTIPNPRLTVGTINFCSPDWPTHESIDSLNDRELRGEFVEITSIIRSDFEEITRRTIWWEIDRGTDR
jgi:hypothetical protein